MYQVNNRIPIESEEHLRMLRDRFSTAPRRMKDVPGFISFRLLKAEDGSYVVAETIFESKEDFVRWTQSEHFRRAHGGRRGSADTDRTVLESYEVLIR